MCTANMMAPSSVSPSPMPNVSPESELLTETSQMPTRASRAVVTLMSVGRRRATIHQMNGTITQYVAVRNALMPGVVC